MSLAVSLAPMLTVSLLLAASCFVVLRMGEISFGQQAYFACGAYCAAVTTALFDWPLALALAAATAAGAAAAWVTGLAALRMTGFQFSLFTLVVAEFVREALARWTWRVVVDGREAGPEGLLGFTGIDHFRDRGFGPDDQAVLLLGIAAAVLAAIWVLERGPSGRKLEAVASDIELAESAGLCGRAIRSRAFVLAGALAGLGGAFFALSVTAIDPTNFSLMLGVHALAYTLLGGLGSIWGPIAGTVVDIVFLEALRAVGAYRMVAFGALLVLILIVRPQGLLGGRRPPRRTGAR